MPDIETERYIPQHDQRTDTDGLMQEFVAGKKAYEADYIESSSTRLFISAYIASPATDLMFVLRVIFLR